MALSIDSFVAVPMPHDLYAQLIHRYPAGVASVIEQVVQDFLDRTAEDFEGRRPDKGGIHWESVFLPDDTQVRTKYFGKHQVAEVTGSTIMWEGRSFPSMSQLARAMRGNTSNNAWKVLEIKRPADPHWQPADYLRR